MSYASLQACVLGPRGSRCSSAPSLSGHIPGTSSRDLPGTDEIGVAVDLRPRTGVSLLIAIAGFGGGDINLVLEIPFAVPGRRARAITADIAD